MKLNGHLIKVSWSVHQIRMKCNDGQLSGQTVQIWIGVNEKLIFLQLSIVKVP